jgi:hypothetical protein
LNCLSPSVVSKTEKDDSEGGSTTILFFQPQQIFLSLLGSFYCVIVPLNGSEVHFHTRRRSEVEKRQSTFFLFPSMTSCSDRSRQVMCICEYIHQMNATSRNITRDEILLRWEETPGVYQTAYSVETEKSEESTDIECYVSRVESLFSS